VTVKTYRLLVTCHADSQSALDTAHSNKHFGRLVHRILHSRRHGAIVVVMHDGNSDQMQQAQSLAERLREECAPFCTQQLVWNNDCAPTVDNFNVRAAFVEQVRQTCRNGELLVLIGNSGLVTRMRHLSGDGRVRAVPPFDSEDLLPA
jgi:phosphoheptose isomerase